MSGYSTELGWFTGIIVFMALMFGVIHYSYDKWDHEIARAKTHHPGWVIRQGVVTDHNAPDFSVDPPMRPSTVTFTDFFDHRTQVVLDLPYRSQVGDTTPIDVSPSGSIYAPYSVDDANQVPNNPIKAHPGFWPAGGVIFGLILSFIIALIIGATAETITRQLPSARGRLGTR